MASQGGRGGGGDHRGRVAHGGQQTGRGNFNGNNGNFGRGASFNNFEAGSSSGASFGGAGFNGHGGQVGNFGFGQVGGTAFSGNGGGFQGNFNGFNGFNGGNGAFQGNGDVFNGAANFQGNNGGYGSGGVQGRGNGNNNGGAAIPYVYPAAADQQHAGKATTGAQGGQQAGSSTVAAAVAGAQPVHEGTAAAEYIPLDESVEEAASAQGKKLKNTAKVKCHRCGIVGHFAIDCVTELCINCELPGHADDECPLLSAPQPHMIMYGIGEERLCFFELPCTKSYKPKMENTRMGSLAVTGGDMTIPQIVRQLQRLVPSEHFHWDVRQVGHNVYKVAFPSKADLERLRFFGTFKVPDSLLEMKFDSWSVQIEPNCLLLEVWLRVSGLPPRRKGDFLAMWGLGILFGKTLQVDMKHTRQHGVARIQIGCLDYTYIPHRMNVLVVDSFYDLTFEVEVPEGADVEMEAPSDDGNDHDDDDRAEGDDKGKQKNVNDINRNQISVVENASTEVQTNTVEKNDPKSTQNSMQRQCSGVRFSPLVQRMMDTSKRLLMESASLSGNRQEIGLRVESAPVSEQDLMKDSPLEAGEVMVGHAKNDTVSDDSPETAAAGFINSVHA
ncbi:hypothetical protein ACQ4PT_014786 [Festuca glaucescens]